MVWLTPKHAPPHVCYYAEFGRSTSNRVAISREKAPKSGSAGAPPPLGQERGRASKNPSVVELGRSA